MNIIYTIQKRSKKKICGIVGGTHLVEADESRLKKTIAALKEINIEFIAVSHCTGDENLEIIGFSQDSRKIKAGMMYIPLIGERFDGHDFIESAFANGASAIISDRDIKSDDKVVIKVEDTLKALQDMARYLRKNRNVKVVGVTGSVGKTSTRDMVYSVVKKGYKTLKTEGNYNNNIGLPF